MSDENKKIQGNDSQHLEIVQENGDNSETRNFEINSKKPHVNFNVSKSGNVVEDILPEVPSDIFKEDD